MSDNDFSITEQNRVRQAAKRACYDQETVHSILDQSLVGHLGFVDEENPFVIPMMFARQENDLLFHGSTKSRLMNKLISGQPICVSVSILDGLVMAKSLFHHSMNYRAVTIFGTGRELKEDSERELALKLISEKTMPSRWEDARLPSVKEMKATRIAAVRIDSASAKVRTGDPVEDPNDLELPVWSGVIPLRQVADQAITASEDSSMAKLPDYVTRWLDEFNS